MQTNKLNKDKDRSKNARIRVKCNTGNVGPALTSLGTYFDCFQTYFYQSARYTNIILSLIKLIIYEHNELSELSESNELNVNNELNENNEIKF